MSVSNLEHVRSVKSHVQLLLFGLPFLAEPISYAEMAIALRQLAEEFEQVSTVQDSTL